MMRSRAWRLIGLFFLPVVLMLPAAAKAQIAVKGKTVYTMAGKPIPDGMVIVRDGKIAAVGSAADLKVPDGFRVLEATVVTPGLVDAHATVGLSGQFNYDHDRDQLESSEPIQPELRALDAYNPQERLIGWVRSYGVTTIHTGHAPGELISGQTMIVKTRGTTVSDAVLVETATIAATLSRAARKDKTSPGTRGKMVAMLRSHLVGAQEYLKKRAAAPAGGKEKNEKTVDPKKAPPDRDLRLEALGNVLERKIPLLVTAHRAHDIASALRLAKEFNIRLILDGGAEAYLVKERLKAAGVPVIVHPTMARAYGDLENASFETAAILEKAGVQVALQSGYESYVPKTRVALFEAAVAAANGLSFEEALATITIDAAQILGIDNRVGSIVVGKDGDLALYDGDPFEYTSHCIGVVIEGEVVSEERR